MKALAKGLMTIALLAATTACDGSPTAGSALVSESDGIAMAAASNFTFTNTPSYSTKNAQTASGSVGGIDFTGSLTTPNPCYDVSASRSVRQTSVTVTVTVTANGNGNTCTQVITNQNYTGRVAGLSAGTYTFTVVHQTDGTAQTAYTSTVTVQ